MGNHISVRSHTSSAYVVYIRNIPSRRVDDGAWLFDNILAVGALFIAADEGDVCGHTVGKTNARVCRNRLTAYKACERRNDTMDMSDRIGA